MSANEIIQRAMSTLQSLGHSPVAAAGILGNLTTESGGSLNTRAIHDGGTGLGIAGWRDPTPGAGRKTDLMNYARAQGADVYDLGTQLKFLDHELRTKETGVLKGLQSAKTPEEAATAFISFERPQGWTAANPRGGMAFTQRANSARTIAGMQPLDDAALGVAGAKPAAPKGIADAFAQTPQAGTSLAQALPGATLPTFNPGPDPVLLAAAMQPPVVDVEPLRQQQAQAEQQARRRALLSIGSAFG